MTLNISVELFTCLFSFLCGISFGFVYDLFSVITYKSSKLVEILMSLFYFVLLAFVSVNVIRFVNDGNFRTYELIFLAIGAIIYHLALQNAMRKLIIFVLRIIYRIVKFLFKIVFGPVIFILRPVKKVINKKYLQIYKKICKNRLTIKQICFRIIVYIGNLKRIYKHK